MYPRTRSARRFCYFRPLADVLIFRLPARRLPFRLIPFAARRVDTACIPFQGCLMNLTAFIVQIIGGALGGYAAGNVSKEMNLGTIGNAIVGALGGGVGGQFLFALLGLSGSVQVVSALLTGAVSGGLATLLIGFSQIQDIRLRHASMLVVQRNRGLIEELSAQARGHAKLHRFSKRRRLWRTPPATPGRSDQMGCGS
jgi:uncharacterized membrane protein YeaQ/YmgE (transglycosylase-associated protein family)